MIRIALAAGIMVATTCAAAAACGTIIDSAGPTDGTVDANASDASHEETSLSDAKGDDDGGGTCDLDKAICTPLPSGFADGRGLVPIDRCAFALRPDVAMLAPNPLLAAIEARAPRVTFTELLNSAARTANRLSALPGAPPGLEYAFAWDADDQGTGWVPRGIVDSSDANAASLVGARHVVAVSWFDPTSQRRGSRVTFVDLPDPEAAAFLYRSAIFVAPTGTPEAPSLERVAIDARGIAWFGRFLFVADTGIGIRVFDLEHIITPNVANDTFACSATDCSAATYGYAIPQVAIYRSQSKCAPTFTSLALDPSSKPPSIVSSEHCAAGGGCSSALAGRLFRWPLDPATGLLAGTPVVPTEAFLMGQREVQGAVSLDGVHFLSSTQPAGDAGTLYRVALGKSATSAWIDNPEGVAVDATHETILGLSGVASARYVFAAKLASYPAP